MSSSYFEEYSNLHRLASESLVAAVKFHDEASLDRAEEYARQAKALTVNYFEVVLTECFIHTIDMERIAFRAVKEFDITPRRRDG